MMDDFSFSGENFYEFLDSLSWNKSVSIIKFKGHGVSMTPFIKNGNTLTIKLLNNKYKVRTGDIVAVKQIDKKKILVHRIIKAKEESYLIKGDNKALSDGWFPREAIIGIITEIKRASGKRIYYGRWFNLMIAWVSKTNILNGIILPLGRLVKQIIRLGIKK
ncbi:MAG: hypothetical protein PF503_17875 [Desulfobacula sp.]|jgi:signal peptidase I|nr:hypothetical protein [Desulfobacula sp.]